MRDSQTERITLGIIEPVSFPGLGVRSVLAKIDTGAYSGAVHCESIKVVRDPASGKKVLKVVPVGPGHAPVLIPDYSLVYARSSSGHRIKRYIATVQITLLGELYDIRIGLTQRDVMKVKVLIGRRFLRENNMLVDVQINQALDTDGGVRQ